jgi:hypothetical protein
MEGETHERSIVQKIIDRRIATGSVSENQGHH